MKKLVLATITTLGLSWVVPALVAPAEAVVVTKRTTAHVHRGHAYHGHAYHGHAYHGRHVHGCRTVTRMVLRDGKYVRVRTRVCT